MNRLLSRTAAPLLVSILAIAPTAAGPDRSAAAEAWRSFESSMGQAEQALSRGDLAAAEAAYAEALAISQRFGARNLRHARALDGLADVHRLGGRHDLAERCYRESLDLFRRLLGVEQPRTATTMHNLAVVLLARGETAEAERLFGESRAIWERTLGEHSLEVAVSLESMAALLQRTDRWEQAEPLIARAREIRRRASGAEHDPER